MGREVSELRSLAEPEEASSPTRQAAVLWVQLSDQLSEQSGQILLNISTRSIRKRRSMNSRCREVSTAEELWAGYIPLMREATRAAITVIITTTTITDMVAGAGADPVV
jgi:hypothetical protein